MNYNLAVVTSVTLALIRWCIQFYNFAFEPVLGLLAQLIFYPCDSQLDGFSAVYTFAFGRYSLAMSQCGGF